MKTFVVYDENGVPAAGLLGQLAFASYILADGTMVAPAAWPALSELSSGRYGFTPLATTGWAVIDTGGALPGYVGIKFDERVESFMVFDGDGAPLAGAATGFSFLEYADGDGDTIANPVVADLVTDLGGGWYKVLAAEGSSYIISTGALPVSVESQARIAPVVTVSPAAGQFITAHTPLQVDGTDDSGAFAAMLLVAEFGGSKVLEVVHDGARFGPMYQGSSNQRSLITGGYRYTVLRDGGWPGAPTLTPYFIDQQGGENA